MAQKVDQSACALQIFRMAKTLALRPSKALSVPKQALAVREPKTLELATVPDRTLDVRRRADGTIMVPGDKGRPDDYLDNRKLPVATPGGGRLIRLADAIAAGADPAKAEAKVLSWGNKRIRQKLADGGTIQRRAGGAGYGGSGSGGQIPPGKGRGKRNPKTGRPLQDQRSTDDRLREIRERSERERAAAKQAGKPVPKPLSLADAKKQLALEDKKKPLALTAGDSQPLALTNQPGKPAAKPAAKPVPGALGLAATPPAKPGLLSDLVGAAKRKLSDADQGAEQVSPQYMAAKAAKGAIKDRFENIKSLWKAGRKDLAVEKALTTGWPTAELQLDAIEWLRKRL